MSRTEQNTSRGGDRPDRTETPRRTVVAANDSEVGRVVLELGLVTPSEIEHCREQQKQASDPNQRSLADLLVENSFITPTQVRRLKGR